MLPKTVRDALKKTWQIEPYLLPGESEARTAAQDAIITQARADYQALFHPLDK